MPAILDHPLLAVLAEPVFALMTQEIVCDLGRGLERDTIIESHGVGVRLTSGLRLL
jgi:hypothetical protein